MFFRYILEACLDITICILIQIHYLGNSEFSTGTRFETVNSVTTIVLGVAIVLFPIFMIVFYCKSFAKWGDEDFEAKYGAVYEGLRKDKLSSLAYPVLFVTRRAVFAFVAIITIDNIFLQIQTLLLFSTIQLIYLIKCRPFEEDSV